MEGIYHDCYAESRVPSVLEEPSVQIHLGSSGVEFTVVVLLGLVGIIELESIDYGWLPIWQREYYCCGVILLNRGDYSALFTLQQC